MGFAKGGLGPRHFKLPHLFHVRKWTQAFQRTFIAPSGFGFTFGSLAVIQLVMAIGSQNNLIYLFVFSEISIALSSMFFTNFNIAQVSAVKYRCETAFAGEESWVEIELETKIPWRKSRQNTPQRTIHKLEVGWNFSKGSAHAVADSTKFSLAWKPLRRGLQNYPDLRLQSNYPFGLLKAWKILTSSENILVFPERKGSLIFPHAAFASRNEENLGLFYDLKIFQTGDSPRRIDWRASLRSRDFLIRRFEQEGTTELAFTWQQTFSIGHFEDRISQLALWVDIAERDGSPYSLSIGNWQSARSQGHSHWEECLRHLAELKKEDFDGI